MLARRSNSGKTIGPKIEATCSKNVAASSMAYSEIRKSPPVCSHARISAARKSRRYSQVATMCTGKAELRPGLKSTGSFTGSGLANRLNRLMGPWSYIVVVLMSLTFISVLLSLFVFMTNGRAQFGHPVGKFEIRSKCFGEVR